jgi:uncharacterized protein (DUF983 family)
LHFRNLINAFLFCIEKTDETDEADGTAYYCILLLAYICSGDTTHLRVQLPNNIHHYFWTK